MISVTATPLRLANAAIAAGALMLVEVQTMHAHLDVEYILRKEDGQVQQAIFSIEMGEINNEPHIQGMYTLELTAEMSTADLKALLKQEKTWLKLKLSEASDVVMRLNVKKYKLVDRKYGFGYVQKDTGLAHFRTCSHGFSDDEKQECLDFYRAKAAGNAYASNKMNKAPKSNEKLLAFKVTNLFVLSAWFVQQHDLSALGPALTLSLVLAYALETGKYRLDDSLVLGRSGGGLLDPVRTQAMFELSISADARNVRETVPLIDLILLGIPQPAATAFADAACVTAGLPTRGALRLYSLAEAKALAKVIAKTQPRVGLRLAQNCGRYIVIDFLASAEGHEVAMVLGAAGLTGTKLFSNDQIPNACGHLAAGWACALRALGTEFHTLTKEAAAVYNTERFVTHAKSVLKHSVTKWLFTEEVQEVATEQNPDGPDEDPYWLNGPGPLEHWRAHFVQTREMTEEHLEFSSNLLTQRVHIWIINTERGLGDWNSQRGSGGGKHWFVAAWCLE
jgi:hypothetical protein